MSRKGFVSRMTVVVGQYVVEEEKAVKSFKQQLSVFKLPASNIIRILVLCQ